MKSIEITSYVTILWIILNCSCSEKLSGHINGKRVNGTKINHEYASHDQKDIQQKVVEHNAHHTDLAKGASGNEKNEKIADVSEWNLTRYSIVIGILVAVVIVTMILCTCLIRSKKHLVKEQDRSEQIDSLNKKVDELSRQVKKEWSDLLTKTNEVKKNKKKDKLSNKDDLHEPQTNDMNRSTSNREKKSKKHRPRNRTRNACSQNSSNDAIVSRTYKVGSRKTGSRFSDKIKDLKKHKRRHCDEEGQLLLDEKLNKRESFSNRVTSDRLKSKGCPSRHHGRNDDR